MTDQSQFIKKKDRKKEKISQKPTSVYLSKKEKEVIDKVAAKHDMTRTGLMKHAILHFLNKYSEDPSVMYESGSAPKSPPLPEI